MTTTLPGHWLDGQTLAARAVTLTAENGRLRITGLETELVFPCDTVRFSDRLGAVPRYLYFPSGATLATPDNDAVDRLLAEAGRGRAAAIIHWLEQRARVAAVATVLLVVSLGLSVFYGLPWAARRAAAAVPLDIEQRAGQAALTTLSQWLGPTQLSARERTRVQRQLSRLHQARDLPAPPRLEFRTMGQFPNAFALPGGIIVVSDELARLASDDELAAVLAHEMGHWQLRHGLQGMLRNSASLLVVTTITGDLSTLTTFAGTIPFALLQSGYSREFEEEADAYALETLRRAKIDRRYLATILHKLEKAHGGSAQDYSYLSTHPATKDRIHKIDPTGTYTALMAEKTEPANTTTVADFITSLPFGSSTPEAKEPQLLILEPPDQPPVALQQTSPVYPKTLRAAGISGDVLVEYVVDTAGNVRTPRILSSPHSDFDAPSLAAVQQWRFKPGQSKGRPVNARVTQSIHFALEDAPADTPK